MSHKQIIGTSTLGYNEIRNFAGLNFKGFQIKKKQNLHKLFAYLYQKRTGRIHKYYWNAFKDFDLNKVVGYHFFNAISFGKKPWITTFETSLPRWDDPKKEKQGLALMAQTACQRLIAMSECAYHIQEGYLEEHHPEFKNTILAKTQVLHPPQKKLITKLSEKHTSKERIHFVLVGSHFLNKGGQEILEAFIHLYQKGIRHFKLSLITSFKSSMYYKDSAERIKKSRRLIDKYSEYISLYEHLENAKVLALLKSADVALLPTYADTYGYAVLEAQAAGCPVISTDIRALSEINNNTLGWLIKVPKDERKNAVLDQSDEVKTYSATLKHQLIGILEDIFKQPDQIKQKAELCLKKIDQKHNVGRITQDLEKYYAQMCV